MGNALVKSCFCVGVGVTALSLIGCGGMNPTQLFGARVSADAMPEAGREQALAVEAGDDGGSVVTGQTQAGRETEAAVMAVDASLEGAAQPPIDDADAADGGGNSTPADAGDQGPFAEGGPPDGPGLRGATPDAADSCLYPPAAGNAAVAATFEADDARLSRWFAFGGCDFQVTSARAHCGTHSARCAVRAAAFQGPGYEMTPTPGTYALSAWVLQDGSSPTSLVWNVKLVCVTNGVATTTYPPASAPVSAPPKTWVFTSGTFVVPSGCTTAEIYLNQLESAPSILPTLFVDDVYIY
ncbi:MAG: hypothetical protein M3O36_08340 [Myxococcota bacterium]|nr:hypothetical protein [Myxococcota bacterium]